MELILVRHGEPRWVVEGRARNDPELTERGRVQAERVADRLAAVDDEPALGAVDQLWVSPAVRAAETASPIADRLGLVADTHGWLLELQMPDAWEGQPIEVAERAFAAQRDRPRAEWWDGMPGAEPLPSFHDRVTSGVEAALARVGVIPTDEHALWEVADDAPERIIAVAHGGTNSTLVAHLLGVEKEPWDWERFRMGHASVAVLRSQPLAGAAIWSLCALGDANHLPLDLRTI